MGLFNKIKKLNIFSGLFSVDEDFFEELEESLILSDMGMETTLEAVETLRERVKERKIKEPEEVKACLREILVEMLAVGEPGLDLSGKPAVILMIGVNGVGKTTTIGKLANRLKADGNRVLLAAGDTFRAAAAEQLSVWAERAQVEIVKHEEGSDPAAVVFDAMNAARARRVDVVLVDTAGRLHNKQNLMNELNKIRRVIDREARRLLQRGSAGSGRHHGTERPDPGQAVQPERRDHRHCAHQAGRDGQRRRGFGHCQGDGRTGEVRGPGGGDRRSPAL